MKTQALRQRWGGGRRAMSTAAAAAKASPAGWEASEMASRTAAATYAAPVLPWKHEERPKPGAEGDQLGNPLPGQHHLAAVAEEQQQHRRRQREQVAHTTPGEQEEQAGAQELQRDREGPKWSLGIEAEHLEESPEEKERHRDQVLVMRGVEKRVSERLCTEPARVPHLVAAECEPSAPVGDQDRRGDHRQADDRERRRPWRQAGRIHRLTAASGGLFAGEASRSADILGSEP